MYNFKVRSCLMSFIAIIALSIISSFTPIFASPGLNSGPIDSIVSAATSDAGAAIVGIAAAGAIGGVILALTHHSNENANPPTSVSVLTFEQTPEIISPMTVGEIQNLIYVIKNNSSKVSALFISGYSAPIYSDQTVENNCNATLAAGANCSIKLVAYPNKAGSISQQLTVADGTSATPISSVINIEVNEQPISPLMFTKLPTMTDMHVGAEQILDYEVSNNSDNGIYASVSINQNNAVTRDDSVANNCPDPNGSIAAHSSCNIRLKVHPTVSGQISNTLTISAPTGDPLVSPILIYAYNIIVSWKDTTQTTYLYPFQSFSSGKITLKNDSARSVTLYPVVRSGGGVSMELLSSSSCNNVFAAGATCSYDFAYQASSHLKSDTTITSTVSNLEIMYNNSSGNANLTVPITTFLSSYYRFLQLPYNLFSYNKLPSNNISSIVVDGNKLYAGTDNGFAISLDGGESWRIYNISNSGLDNNKINEIYTTNNKIYVATDNGLTVISNPDDPIPTFKTFTQADGLGDDYVNGVCVTNNKIYASTYGGLTIISNPDDLTPTFKNLTQEDGLGDTVVLKVYITNDKVYVATYGGGLTIISNPDSLTPTFKTFTKTDGLGSNYVNGVYVTNNKIYAATNSGLTVISNPDNPTPNFKTFTSADGLGSDYILGVYVTNNKIYASTDGGLTIISNPDLTPIFKTFTSTDGLGSDTVNGVYVTNNEIYAATYGGLTIISNPDSSSPAFNTLKQANGLGNDALGGVYVYGIYVADNKIYASTDGGLTIISNPDDPTPTFKTFTQADGLGSDEVTSVYVINNKIYVATYDGGLTIISNPDDPIPTFKTFTQADGLGSDEVTSVYVINNKIYAATYGGLTIISDPDDPTPTFKTFTQQAGELGSNYVYGVYVTNNKIYASTDGGLTVISNPDDPIPTFKTFTKADGLGSSSVNGVYVANNKIYAATISGGLTVISNPDNTPTFKTFTQADGLGSDYVFEVYVTNHKIYTATAKGVYFTLEPE